MGTESFNTISPPIHQKLGEVPLNIFTAIFIRLLAFQGFVEIACAVAVNLDFGEDGKIDIIIGFCKFQYLCIGTRFLGSKLITGKTEDREVSLTVGFLKGTQTCVLWCKSSLTCQIYDQQHLIPII